MFQWGQPCALGRVYPSLDAMTQERVSFKSTNQMWWDLEQCKCLRALQMKLPLRNFNFSPSRTFRTVMIYFELDLEAQQVLKKRNRLECCLEGQWKLVESWISIF